jgi:hypothetical protein
MSASLSTSASAPRVKHSTESLLFGVDFTKLLAAGETLTGTPSVTAPAGITISSPAVNSQAFTNDDGATVAVAAGVQFRATGGLSPTDYVLTVTCGTSAGNTRTVVCTLQVRDA